jgi:hypothetical protein
VEYTISPVYYKPKKIKKSKYDELIDLFLNSDDPFLEINSGDINIYNLKTQLNNRINKKYLTDRLFVKIINKNLYLKKVNYKITYKIILKDNSDYDFEKN